MRWTFRSWVASTLLLVVLAACADGSTTTERSAPSTPPTTPAASDSSGESRPTSTSAQSPTTSSTPAAQHRLRIAYSLGGFPFETAGTWTDCVSLSDPSVGPGTTVTVTDGDRAVVGSGTLRSLNEGDLADPVLMEVAQRARNVPPGKDGECVVVAEFDVADSAIYFMDYGEGAGVSYSNAQLEKQGWFIQEANG